MSSNRYIYSVSELNAAAKSVLENDLGRIWIEAEISNMSRPASGHWYFTLKDQKAQIRCAFFKGSNRLVNFTPEDGQLLLVRGRVSLYEPRGDYQLIVDQMEPAGIGDLQRAFEETRQRLLEAGLFDEAHKQPLPAIPKRIGLITSPSGAAIRDVLHVLRRRYPMVPVVLYPTSVQGASAATEIMQALGHAVNRNECDVLLMTRGGGSIEDLWPFNDEQLAKAIYDCPIPIISGVGHEIDFTIADFVADVRAPTPSAAAEMLVPDQLELRRLLQRHQRQLTQQMQDTLRTAAQQTDWYRKHINQFHPGRLMSNMRENLVVQNRNLQQIIQQTIREHHHQLSHFEQRIINQSPDKTIRLQQEKIQTMNRLLGNSIRTLLERAGSRLANSTHTLNAVSPVATLSRGYSITFDERSNTAVRKASEVEIGDTIKTRLANGQLLSRVESIDE